MLYPQRNPIKQVAREKKQITDQKVRQDRKNGKHINWKPPLRKTLVSVKKYTEEKEGHKNESPTVIGSQPEKKAKKGKQKRRDQKKQNGNKEDRGGGV